MSTYSVYRNNLENHTHKIAVRVAESDIVGDGFITDDLSKVWTDFAEINLSEIEIGKFLADTSLIYDAQTKTVRKSDERILQEQALQLRLRTMQVKQLASQKILALVPEWTKENIDEKQRNALARWNELIEKKFDNSLSEIELTELTSLRFLWSKIKAIRAASNAIETRLKTDLNTDIGMWWPEV